MEKVTIAAYTRRLKSAFDALSQRERVLIVTAVVVGIVICLYMVISPISAAFSSQSQAYEKRLRDAATAGAVIERFVKLQARQEEIERRFREVEFQEGALTHLEVLLRKESGIMGSPTIRDGTPRQFGKQYEQVPFTLKFQVSDIKSLVSFLEEVVHGERPLILSRVRVEKNRRGDRLDVDVNVSTIRRVKAEGGGAGSGGRPAAG